MLLVLLLILFLIRLLLILRLNRLLVLGLLWSILLLNRITLSHLLIRLSRSLFERHVLAKRRLNGIVVRHRRLGLRHRLRLRDRLSVRIAHGRVIPLRSSPGFRLERGIALIDR